MFISHLLATGEVKADHSTEANECRKVEDKEDVLGHVAVRIKTSTPNYSLLNPAINLPFTSKQNSNSASGSG